MLFNKSFRLKLETLGIESLTGNRNVVVQVPAGSVVRAQTGSSPFNRSMIMIQWAGRELAMFLEDVQTRGEVVTTRRDQRQYKNAGQN
jgi:hypothetical protein